VPVQVNIMLIEIFPLLVFWPVGLGINILKNYYSSLKFVRLKIFFVFKVRTVDRYQYTEWRTSVWLECCIFTDIYFTT
jgi:hypothetical protein